MKLNDIKCVTKEFFRNEIIYKENTDCNSIAIIKRGIIKKSNPITGNITILNQNDYIGLEIIFSSNKKYTDTYIAASLVTISIISLDDLVIEMYKNIDLFQYILAYLSNNNQRLTEHINALKYKTIKQKLCYYLYQEYKKTNAMTFVINYTKQELANFLSIDRHLLSNELTALIENKIIANQNKLYTIIDLEKIKSIIRQ